MTRKLLVGAIAAGALTVTAGTAFALSPKDAPTRTAAQVTTSESTSVLTSESTATPTGTPAAPTALTADDARRIATDRFGGTVREVEREFEHGRVEWKVEITASDGVTYDVRVDASTGAITRVDRDDRGGDVRGGDVRSGGDDRGGDRHGGDDPVGDDHGHDRGGDDHGGERHGGDDH